MKMKDALAVFAFTDTSALIDSEDNVVGCKSEYGDMSCANCQYTACPCHPSQV